MTDLLRVQKQILHLVDIASRAESGDAEGRSAAMLACKMIRQHGFLVVQPSELVTFAPPPVAVVPQAPPPKKPSRKKSKTVRETAQTVADAADDTAQVLASVSRAANAANAVFAAFRRR